MVIFGFEVSSYYQILKLVLNYLVEHGPGQVSGWNEKNCSNFQNHEDTKVKLYRNPFLCRQGHFNTRTLQQTETRTFLQTDTCTHGYFYTRIIHHTDTYTWIMLHKIIHHTDISTHGHFYAWILLHTDTSTHGHFIYVAILLHTDTSYMLRHLFTLAFTHAGTSTHGRTSTLTGITWRSWKGGNHLVG